MHETGSFSTRVVHIPRTTQEEAGSCCWTKRRQRDTDYEVRKANEVGLGHGGGEVDGGGDAATGCWRFGTGSEGSTGAVGHGARKSIAAASVGTRTSTSGLLVLVEVVSVLSSVVTSVLLEAVGRRRRGIVALGTGRALRIGGAGRDTARGCHDTRAEGYRRRSSSGCRRRRRRRGSGSCKVANRVGTGTCDGI